jgi:hypothetical protein
MMISIPRTSGCTLSRGALGGGESHVKGTEVITYLVNPVPLLVELPLESPESLYSRGSSTFSLSAF